VAWGGVKELVVVTGVRFRFEEAGESWTGWFSSDPKSWCILDRLVQSRPKELTIIRPDVFSCDLRNWQVSDYWYDSLATRGAVSLSLYVPRLIQRSSHHTCYWSYSPPHHLQITIVENIDRDIEKDSHTDETGTKASRKMQLEISQLPSYPT